MREILEEIKSLVDEIYAKDPGSWWGTKEMILHPPASGAAIKKFFQSPPGKGLPPSYGDFLSASDGLETGWQRLSFLGTVKSRQKPILSTVKYLLEDQAARFESFEGKPTPEKVKAWEAKVDRLYLANHPIVATTDHGHRLVYDVRTRDKKGEMELCWWRHGEAAIAGRHAGIGAYFESVLAEVRRYHRKVAGKGRKK